jgi:hypothetical protein
MRPVGTFAVIWLGSFPKIKVKQKLWLVLKKSKKQNVKQTEGKTMLN